MAVHFRNRKIFILAIPFVTAPDLATADVDGLNTPSIISNDAWDYQPNVVDMCFRTVGRAGAMVYTEMTSLALPSTPCTISSIGSISCATAVR